MDPHNQLNERKKELNCIYQIDRLIDENKDVHTFLSETCRIIADGFLFPANTSVSIEYGDIIVKSPHFQEGKNRLSANISHPNNEKGVILVFYSGKKNGNPFLDEEQILIDSIGKRISDYLFLNMLVTQNENLESAKNTHIDARYKILKDAVGTANFKDLGMYSIYLIGSVKNYESGVSSDIDLIVYYDGEPLSMEKIKLWFKAWSESVIKSGRYHNEIENMEHLFDLHFITKTDIEQGSSYAVMIKSFSNSARLIKTIL